MLLTVRQAAQHLGVSVELVYRLCAARKLRHERHGLGRGRVLIPEDALDEYRRAVTVSAEPGKKAVPTPPAHLKLKHIRV